MFPYSIVDVPRCIFQRFVAPHHSNCNVDQQRCNVDRKLGATTAAFCDIKMACRTRRLSNANRKMYEEDRTKPSILSLFKVSMRNFATHRNGLKEARDAIVASRAAMATLRAQEGDRDISSDDDMEANSGDDNREFEEFVDEIM